MNPGDTCTPIYGLPYPTGISDPCLVGDTMCDFAEAVEEQLDAVDTIVSQLQNPPFAYASNIAEMNYNNNLPGGFVPFFDTTLADTDNMINLSSNPTIITINTAGVYSFFGDIEMNVPNTGAGATIQLLVLNATGSQVDGTNWTVSAFTQSTGMPQRTDGTRAANMATTFEWVSNVGVGYTVSATIFVSGPTGLVSNIQTFRVGAIWLRSPL